jgi:hypothetical protein
MIVIKIGRQIIMKNNFYGRICKCRSLMGRCHDNVEKKKVIGERSTSRGSREVMRALLHVFL